MERLTALLGRLDGKPYGAYKALKGRYRGDGFTLEIDHVQGDPFAAPSRVQLKVPHAVAALPEGLWDGPDQLRALADYLTRAVERAIQAQLARRSASMGMGRSGEIAICRPGQQILTRTSVVIDDQGVSARLTVGLPARGRTILAKAAARMLTEELPNLARQALIYASLDGKRLAAQVASVVDQVALRGWLRASGNVAFLADGSHLARRSGIDDRPLTDQALPLVAPDSLAATVDLPSGATVRGLAIPRGVTLIVGGGFHGKSTLLSALQTGVYDHRPGDGRERVVADATAVTVRAEDGRYIAGADLTPFINHLPLGRDSQNFTTDNASGSTSQAAAIVEALAVGSTLLLIDEDTSATNFMIRDGRMQRLVAKEPITPLLHRVRELYERLGVSSVIVMGGSGDYFEVADTVIMMDGYTPKDVTAQAHALAQPPQLIGREALTPLTRPPEGRMVPQRGPERGNKRYRIDVRERGELGYGTARIDLSKVAQLVEPAQTRAIGHLLARFMDRHRRMGLVEGLSAALLEAHSRGLDDLTPHVSGDLAMPRLMELAAAVSRMRP